MYKLLILPSQDLISDSPYLLAYNSYCKFGEFGIGSTEKYCKEKFFLSHSWESNGLLSVSSKKYVVTKLLSHLATAFLAYQITVKKN